MRQSPLWQPSPDLIEKSNLSRFMARLGVSLDPDAAMAVRVLHRKSIVEADRFWSELWGFANVKGDMGGVPHIVQGETLAETRFFPDARLNYAENLLSRRGDAPALLFRAEEQPTRSVSWDELRRLTACMAAALQNAGVGLGDRIGAVLPATPEAVAAMLGAAATGAVWTSCSPDFGIQGVTDRLGQAEPKVLIACAGYRYNGKEIDIGEKLSAIVDALPTLRLVIVVPSSTRPASAGEVIDRAARSDNATRGVRWSTWNDAVAGRGETEPQFVPLPFDHPLCILFSSGTTGKPKGILHRSGGLLLKHLSEHQLHCDLKTGDRLFYFTTLGWMMWNWLVSGLASGATLMLYDGSPFAGDGRALWDYLATEGCTHLGTSAKYIDAARKSDLHPAATHDLSSLRMVLSTGSPLADTGFDYVYERIKSNLHLASISGGTDICGCFVLGNPLLPVWCGEIQGPALGLDIDVVDDAGRHVSGGTGELVCRNAFPSIPVGFWNDPSGERFHAAYFARFPGLWHHGDFAEWTEHDGIVISGRSDATLNPGGVRIGTAEIYAQVEKLPEVVESIAVGQAWEGDVRVVLFVVLAEGASLSDDLVARVKRQIRDGASPRHVPAKIIAVTDIPRTRSGKITELAVRDIIAGRPVRNVEALANPDALDLFRDLPELAR